MRPPFQYTFRSTGYKTHDSGCATRYASQPDKTTASAATPAMSTRRPRASLLLVIEAGRPRTIFTRHTLLFAQHMSLRVIERSGYGPVRPDAGDTSRGTG